jgi:dUTP pyrophosphatase
MPIIIPIIISAAIIVIILTFISFILLTCCYPEREAPVPGQALALIFEAGKCYTEREMTAVLSRQDIHRLLQQEPPLVEGYLDLETQVQPNGIDLTLREISMLQTPGRIAVSNDQRLVSDLAPLVFDGLDFIDLMPGIYTVTYNEIVHLPNNVMALGRPRSSLLRCGVTIDTAVWDAGYSGRSESLMIVYHPQGFRLQRNARVLQLVFFQLTRDTEGYRGTYQGENI